MCKAQSIAMLAALLFMSACGNNNFNNAYSIMDLGNVEPIALDD